MRLLCTDSMSMPLSSARARACRPRLLAGRTDAGRSAGKRTAWESSLKALLGFAFEACHDEVLCRRPEAVGPAGVDEIAEQLTCVAGRFRSSSLGT